MKSEAEIEAEIERKEHIINKVLKPDWLKTKNPYVIELMVKYQEKISLLRWVLKSTNNQNI